MIKQGVVQEKVAELSNGHPLPPMSNLPQWSRVNMLDKARFPKPFVKDRVTHVEGIDQTEVGDASYSDMDTAQRISHLERNIQFIRQQHQDILKSLHEEIDKLKKENKDLQFKIVMSQKSLKPDSSSSNHSKSRVDALRDGSSKTLREDRSMEREDKFDELRVIFLEEEIKELKHALRESRNRNTYITQLLDQSQDNSKRQQAALESLRFQLAQGAKIAAEHVANGTNPFDYPQERSPSLAECEAIIRHLQKVNEDQQHELETLKSDLRDVLYSHKWTPDAYLLAKAYITSNDGDAKSGEISGKSLPKIALKTPARKLPDIAYVQNDTVSLPALKQTVSNKAVERKKRTQILQKARFKREVIP